MISPGSRSRLFIEWFLNRKDYCFSKGVYNQQFQQTILLIVGLTSWVSSGGSLGTFRGVDEF